MGVLLRIASESAAVAVGGCSCKELGEWAVIVIPRQNGHVHHNKNKQEEQD